MEWELLGRFVGSLLVCDDDYDNNEYNYYCRANYHYHYHYHSSANYDYDNNAITPVVPHLLLIFWIF